MVGRLESLVTRQWYAGGTLSTALRPLGALYCVASRLRAGFYARGRRRSARLPSLVVGNLTAGGSGKTPLVLAIARHLVQTGWRPALVSRGYRAHPPGFPYLVSPADDPTQAGDEPLLLAQRSGLPVVIGPDRLADVDWLFEHQKTDIVVLDDGFQHLRLMPDLSFVVVDGQRGFGVARCLPAGPLREPLSALGRADALIANGSWVPSESILALGLPVFEMRMQPRSLLSVRDAGVCQDLAFLKGQRVHAVSGIGHPERFFDQLERLGATLERHPFPDHHAFKKDDFRHMRDAPVVMTEKDAVKCGALSLENTWALRIEAALDPTFWGWLDQRLGLMRSHQHGH